MCGGSGARLRTARFGDAEDVTVAEKLRSAAHAFDGGTPGVRPVAREAIATRLERLNFLDAPAGLLQRGMRAAVPQGTAKDVLSGTWLGHPVHPPLTDIVIGSWTSAWLLDAVGGTKSRPASQLLLGSGIVAALPTAAAGLSDWAELRGGTRRVGFVHALGNVTALTLQILSLRARRRGDHRSGVGLSTLAMTVGGASAWLGGHLSFGRGVGVNQTAFEELPDEWTPVADEPELAAGAAIRREAAGIGVMIARHHGEIHALADRCSHRGCSLAEGTFGDGTITCRCHGSTFSLGDGSVVTGPATAPQPSLEVRVRAGKVEVRRRVEED
jgi:nitrite reductase/ring-hydroxylating ferredoxin subunit/uncharacterized membrane protein